MQDNEQSIIDLIRNCIQPTILDVSGKFVLPIFIINLITIWLITFFEKARTNIISRLMLILSGIILLFNHYKEEYYQLIFLTTVILFTSFFVAKLIQCFSYKQSFLWIIWCQQLTIVTLNEYLIFSGFIQCIKLRPNLMLILMKSISYYYETQLSILKKDISFDIHFIEVFFDFLSYLLHPSTIILGIWHPHLNHIKLFYTRRKTNNLLKNIYYSIGLLILSILFLISSTCLIDYFLNQIISEYFEAIIQIFIDNPQSSFCYNFIMKLVSAYSIAIQFHYSHYFISYLGQSMLEMWNYG